MTGVSRWLVPLAVTVLVLACASIDRPRAQGGVVALPTPLRSFDASVSATLGQLQSALTAIGERLEVPIEAYRPSEPQSLLQAPRVVLRADLADPDDGYMVIYPAVDAAAAEQRALELAAYLGSGLGQTNFPADTRFSVAVVGDTVVFTSWSPGRTSDRQRAEAVFDAVASVGRSVEIRR